VTVSVTKWPTTRRLKMLADVRVSNVDKKSADGEPEVRLCNYTDVYYQDRITGNLEFMSATAPPHQIRAFALRPDDVLITKDSESWDDIAVPAVVVDDVQAICGYHLAHLRPKPNQLDGRFLFYSLMSGPTAAHFKVEANGVTRYAIGVQTIGDAPIPAPSLATQIAVADYLDSETARIDALIDCKQRFIDLLLEKRTALITHAVTKGLDPDVEMKDSGIEWLGEIPRDWRMAPLRYLLLESNAGEVIPKEYWHDGDEQLYTCQRTPMRSTFDEFPVARRTREGDLLLTRNGMPYCHQPEPNSIYSNVVQRIRLSTRITPNYASIALSSGAHGVRGFGDIIESFNMGVWKSLFVPLPPLDEQRAIVAAVATRTAEMDTLVDKTRKSIELLSEYRTALISAAVTGQIEIPATDSGEDVA